MITDMGKSHRYCKYELLDRKKLPYPTREALARFRPMPPYPKRMLDEWVAHFQRRSGWGRSSVSTACLVMARVIAEQLDETGAAFIPFVGTVWLSPVSGDALYKRVLPKVKFHPERSMVRRLRGPFKDPWETYRVAKKAGKGGEMSKEWLLVTTARAEAQKRKRRKAANEKFMAEERRKQRVAEGYQNPAARKIRKKRSQPQGFYVGTGKITLEGVLGRKPGDMVELGGKDLT